MSSIDERIVEMQFDNDQFESGIKQSTDSLDKFKSSLNFEGASKGLDNVSNTISQFTMDGVTTAVETANHSFSALETVATAALVNITNQAISAGESLLASLSIDQITAGYDKYTQKLSNVQTIMNSTGESVETVNGYMDHLMWYSDETSYGFTDMTGALANMVATGGEVETLIPMIEGVANATAYAGQNATAFSYVMSAVNSAYSRGYMQATDWARIEHQNAASKALQETFIETAEALGKLEEGSVTLENFRNSLSNGSTAGWLDTEVMEESFGVFSEMTEAAYELIEAGEFDTATEAYKALESEYGDIAVAAAEAAQQAKTFGEAIDATKDAVSSQWSKIMDTLFGDYDQATQLWTDLSEELYDIFAQPIGDFAEVLAEGFGGGGYKDAFSQVSYQFEEAGISAEEYTQAINDVMSAKGFDWLIEEYGSVQAAFNALDVDLRSSMISSAIDELCSSTGEATMSMEELEDVAHRVWSGEFGNGDERIQALTDAGYDYEVVQAAVNQLINEGAINFDEFSDAELEAMGYDDATIQKLRELQEELGDYDSAMYEAASSTEGAVKSMSGFELLWNGLGNLGKVIEDIGKAISDAWSAVFDGLEGDDIHNALQSFYDFTQSLQLSEDTIEKISDAFQGLFSVLNLIANVVSTVLTKAFNLLSPILSKVGGIILNVASAVGKVVTAFNNWIKENNIIGETFDKIVGVLTTVKDAVVSFVESILEMPQVQSIIESVSNVFTKVLNGLKRAFPGTTATIKGFIKTFDGLENINFDKIVNIFKAFGKDILNNFQKQFPEAYKAVDDFIKKFQDGFEDLDFSDISKLFSDLWNGLKSGLDDFISGNTTLSAIRDKVLELWDAFKESSGINFEGITKSISDFKEKVVGYIDEILEKLGILTGEGDESVADAAEPMTEGLEALEEGLEVVDESAEEEAGILSRIGSALGSFFSFISNLNVGQIIGAAVAIGILVGVLTGLYAAAKIASAVTGITKAIKQLTSAFKMQSFGNTALEIATAITILAAALFVLAQLPVSNLIASCAAIVILAGVLIGLSAAMGALTKNGYASAADSFGILALAGSLIIVVAALKLLDTIDLNAALVGKVAILAAVIAGLIIAMNFLSKMSGNSFNTLGIAGTMLALTVAIGLMVGVLKSISEIQDDLDLGTVGYLAAIVAALIAAMALLDKLTTGKSTLSNAASLLALPIALKLLISCLDDLADYDTEKILTALTNFIPILGMMASLAVVSRIAGGKGGGTSMLAMAASIVVMAAAIAILGNLDSGAMAQGLAAVEMLVVTFGAIMSLYELIGKIPSKGASSGAGTILAMAAAIAVMAVAVAALSLVDPTSLSNATDAMTQLMLIFALVEGLSALTGKGSASTIISLVAMIGTIALALGGLSTCDPEAVNNAANAITQLSLVFAALELVSGFTKNGSMSTILSLVAVIGTLSLALGLLANLTDPGDLSSVADSLTETLLSVSVMLVAMSAMSKFGGSGLAGSILGMIPTLLSVLAVVGVITAVIAGVGALINGLGWADGIIAGMETIGEIFGAIVGGFAGGVIASAASAMADSTEDLKRISDAITPLTTCITNLGSSLKNLDESSVDKIGVLAKALLELTGAELLDAITSLITNEDSFSQLSDGLTSISTAMKTFAEDSKDLNLEDFNKGMEAVQALTDARATLQSTRSLLSIFTGQASWSDLSTGLAQLAGAIKNFSDKMVDVSIDNVQKGATAIEALATAQTSIEAVGGLVDAFTGTSDWSTLTDGLDGVAESLTTFSSTLTEGGFDSNAQTNINNAVACLESLAGAQGKIETAGGVLGKLVGETEWSTLSNGLASMGRALVGFSSAITDGGGIDATAITEAATALGELATVQGDVTESGGFFSMFTGDTSWSTLSNDLGSLGRSLASFSNSSKQVDTDAVEKGTEAIESLITLGDAVEGHTDAFAFVENNLAGIGTAVADFGNEISDVTWPDNMGQLPELLESIGSICESLNSVVGIFGTGDKITEALQKVLGGLAGPEGGVLVDFVNAFSGLEWPDMSSLSELISSISEAATAASMDNGNMSALNNLLIDLLPTLTSFCSDMTGMELPDLTSLSRLINNISTAADKVNDTDADDLGSLLTSVATACEQFKGVVVPDDSNELVSFVSDLVTACTIADGVTIDSSLAEMLSNIAEIFNSFDLGGENGSVQGIITDLTEFATELDTITWPTDMEGLDGCVTAIEESCQKFKDIKYPDTSKLTTFTDTISEALASASSTTAGDFVGEFISGVTTTDSAEVNNAAASLVSMFKSGIVENESQISDEGEEVAKKIISGLDKQSSELEDAGEAAADSIKTGIENAESDMLTAATVLCKAIVTTFGNSQDDFVTCGKHVVSAVAEGMRDTSAIVSAAYSMINQAVSTLNSGYDSFYGAGQYNAEGFKQGILSKANDIAQAAAEVVTDAIAAANDAQNSASPSKVMMQSGEWFDQGYINGIIALIPLVEKAAANMVDEAVDTVASESSNLSSVLEDEMNFNPVITPVLDLSQVEAGAASMNGMFLNTPSMRVNTDQITGAFGAMSNFQNGQRNPNADLLSAIKGLDERLGSVRGNVYNVNGVTYDDGTNVADAIGQLMHAAKIERRV